MKFCFLFFFILHVDYSFLVLPPLSTSISNEDVEYILLHISTSYVCHFNAMIFSTRVVATCNYGTILLPTPWHIHHHLDLMCRSILLTSSPTYLPHFAKGKNMPYWSFFRYNSITTKKKGSWENVNLQLTLSELHIFIIEINDNQKIYILTPLTLKLQLASCNLLDT